MTLLLTSSAVRQIFPEAPQAVVDAFASIEGQRRLQSAGITDNAMRLAVAMAHCHHETGGFTIRNLTENINYSAERMAVVWPGRFSSAAAVRAKYGTAPGWQKKAFDDIYGDRMGNRPGTSDGSAFIGRGAPQVTGRDGYREVGKRCGLPLEAQPELACLPENQPAILAAFWMWKAMGPLADAGGIDATVRPWNGGTNGLADRKTQFARILPIVKRLAEVPELPAAPTPKPRPVATPAPAGAPVKEAGGGLAGAVVAGGAAAQSGLPWYAIAGIVIVAAVIGYALMRMLRRKP